MPAVIDLSSVIQRLSNPGTFTITRFAGSAFVNGRYATGAPSTFQIRAVIQIAEGRDLLILPEGLRSKEIIVVFTATLLTTAKATAPQNDADQLTYLGAQWEIVTAEDRSGPGNYYRCLAKKMGQ
jgi:hypothetical protein